MTSFPPYRFDAPPVEPFNRILTIFWLNRSPPYGVGIANCAERRIEDKLEHNATELCDCLPQSISPLRCFYG
jgi:hypothetical protein